MAQNWMVTTQTERQRLIGREVVKVMEVGFTTIDGDSGWVDIPVMQYVPDHVAAEIDAIASEFIATHHLQGVTVTHIIMRNDYVGAVETPMVVISFTTPTGATATVEVPAEGFDQAAAAQVIMTRADALDHVAGL